MKKLIGITLLSATICVAMDNAEQSVEKKSDPLSVITGVLVIHPYERIMYAPWVQNDIKKVLDLEMVPSDPLVSVRTFEGDGSSRSLLYLPEFVGFPTVLPLSVLRGKKDKDELTFVSAKQKEQKIVLTCNQSIKNVQSEFSTLEGQLAHSIEQFKEDPHWHWIDKKDLIERGIIVKIGKGGGYQHGPSGYKFD